MKSYFGYIRVSTAKQGIGVSLGEQKAAIERYATRNGLSICEWFQERKTAAKRGRPVFGRMLSLLRKAKAAGVIIHKIDRSARNLKDWADLGDLIDAGVDVHFAADALDLNSRGGRLSADIQAVVAADYIRNLREETKKGFYGRLKQGLYPLGAPVGYLDQGGGKAKIPDPAMAPFIRQAFELYSTGTYTARTLRTELLRRGFRKPKGGALHLSSLLLILNNPFYAGLIRLKKTGETFQGVHEPLVSIATFDRVQNVLKGKLVPRLVRHDFTLRKLFACGCGRTLIGERQKGHVYFRCHNPECPTTGIREEQLEGAVLGILSAIQLTSEEVAEAKAYVERATSALSSHDNVAALTLALDNARSRLNRLTDAFVDGLLEKAVFEERRATLIADIAGMKEDLATADDYAERKQAAALEALELLENLVLGYQSASPARKREIIEITCSNRILCGKKLAIELRIPFDRLGNYASDQSGAPDRRTPRTGGMGRQRQKALRAFVDYIMQDENTTITEKRPRSIAA